MPLQTHEQAHKQNIMNNMWVTHTTHDPSPKDTEEATQKNTLAVFGILNRK